MDTAARQSTKVTATEAHWTAGDRSRVFTRRWTPAGGRSSGTVLLVHGIGEHSGRYEVIGRHLGGAGYTVLAIDLRGHGRSDGKRGHLRFADVYRDLDGLLAEERARGGKLYLYGHSLGGLIVLSYALLRRPAVAGVVASAAALHTALREQPVKVAVANLLGRVLPQLTVPSGLDATKLTRDPAELAAYLADPLVHRRASLGLAVDTFGAIDHLLAHAADIAVPLLLIHGSADQVNYLSGSELVASRLPGRCTLRVYPDVFHKPHHDPESARILDDVAEWLAARG